MSCALVEFFKTCNRSHRRDQISPCVQKERRTAACLIICFLAWQKHTLLLGMDTSKIPFFATSFNRRFICFATRWPWRPTESLKYTRTHIKRTSKGWSISFYSSRLVDFTYFLPLSFTLFFFFAPFLALKQLLIPFLLLQFCKRWSSSHSLLLLLLLLLWLPVFLQSLHLLILRLVPCGLPARNIPLLGVWIKLNRSMTCNITHTIDVL